jgi:DNA-binding NarL/FixJ family response regulator
MRSALTTEVPLIGRAVELDRIVAALKAPAPAAFVLAGAAGVGKTRLAAEAADAAAGLGFSTARVVGSTATVSIPFGPFAPFLPVSDLAPGDLLGLLHRASRAIVERAGPERRLLLVVDDAQLLDDGSAALVYQLVQAASCSVLATVRTPGSAPGPVTALWKDGLAERVDLNPLSEADVEELVGCALGGLISTGSVRRLWEASGGNALWLRELLIGATQSGALTEKGGMWSLHLPLTAPDRLVELVATRLGGLAAETVGVVELIAVGEPLGLSMLANITNMAALEEAERHGFVRASQDGRRTEVRLAHPVYGEALRQSLPRARLRRTSALLAGALEATGARRREDLLRLARWQLDAGDRGDPNLLGRAAQRASEMFDFELAGRLARKALDSGGGVEAGLVLGECEFRLGRHQEAESVFAGLVALCTTDPELAMVTNARVYNLSILVGDHAAATVVLDEALAVITDVTARLKLLGRLATNRIFAAEPGSALAAASELLASDDDQMVSRGAYVSSIALALLGRGDEAVAVAYRGLAAHRRLMASNQLPETLLVGAVLGHAASGRLGRAEEDATTAYKACLAAGDKEGQATFSFLKGSVLVEEGRLAAAARLFLEGASINRELRDVASLRWCSGGLALAAGMAGHAGPADGAVAELKELPAGWIAIFELDLIERGRAWAAVAGGEVSRARHILRVAAERAAKGKQLVVEARLLHDIARLGDPTSVAPRLRALALTAGGELVAALSGHAEALVQGSASKLADAAVAFDALGASLLAAEASVAAAAAYRSEGSQRRASAAARRAQELLAGCGDVVTPGLSRDHDTDRLTQREREVAGLAAAGLASREIAAKLFLSVRTIDNHLQSAYSKLGVTSRDELARALRPATGGLGPGGGGPAID